MWSPLRLGWASLFCFILCITPALSLHESDAGIVDWHKQFIGVPLLGAPTTAPKTHPGQTPGSGLVLAATSNNVLAALNSTTGEIAWRFIHEPEDRIAGFYAHQDVVAVLSGPGGSTLRLLHAYTGALVLEKSLHPPQAGHLSEPHHLGKHTAFDVSMQNAYVLTNGHTVTKLDAKSGEVVWTWSSPDQASLTIYSHLVPALDALYSIGFSKSFNGLTLHVTSLNPTDGSVLASKEIPSSINDLSAYLPVYSRGETSHPHLLWHEDGGLKSTDLTPSLTSKPISLKHKILGKKTIAGLIDVGLAAAGHVVVLTVDGTEHLVRLDGEVNGYMVPYSFETEAVEEGKEAKRTHPIWSGDVGRGGDVWVTRIFWELDNERALLETYKFGANSGQRPLIESLSSYFDFDTATHGIIRHATLSSHSDTSISLTLTTSSGAIQAWALDASGLSAPTALSETWTREESLATVVAAEFVELPEVIGEGESKDEGFIERLIRQTGDAKNFPQYLVGFVRRFVTGSYDTPVTKSTPVLTSLHGAVSSTPPTRDPFGFRQLLITATMYGKVYALDSRDGSIVWSRVLGFGWAAEVGASIHPVKIFVLDNSEVVLIAQRRADNTLVDTVAFHFDALTGSDVSVKHTMQGFDLPPDTGRLPLQGVDVISGPVVEAFLLAPAGSVNSTKAILLLDEYLQVHVFPNTPDTQATLAHHAPTLNFPLRTNSPNGSGQKRLLGHKVIYNHDISDHYTAYATWSLSLPEGEDIKSIIPSQKGEVASLGKVLGNRTTLYKYLNPRMFVLLTAPRAGHPIEAPAQPKPTCGIYVVDSAKGSIIYRAAVPTAAGTCDVKAALVENRLVYHYYDEEYQGPEQTKGWRITSVEMYEGKAIDDKTSSSDMSSFSTDSVNVQTFEQSYVFPHAVTALAFTSTKFGMTSKDLIVASRNNQVQSIHHRLLNPRRPNRKVTTEEQEEFLIPYDPSILYDPKRVLSHNYEVANVQRIVTSPALLESTSLVFAHGLDMFLTRVSPSGTFDVLSESFNKVQLVFTVAGLALAIVFTKPMVKKKKLQEKWY